MFNLRLHRQVLMRLLVGTILSAQGIALAQERTTKLVTSPEQEKYEIHSAADVLQQIQIAAQLPDAGLLGKKNDSSVRVWVNRIHLGIDNVYSSEQIRYLALRVTLVNLGDKPVSVNSGKITLTGWGETYRLGEHDAEFDLMPVKVEREVHSMNELETPEQVPVPEQKAISFWAVFSGLAKSHRIEELLLQVPLETGEIVRHDLREEQRARLALQSEKIGPASALGILTVHGALNTVNAQDLAVQLESLVEKRVKRCVIGWRSGAPAPVDDLVDWLLHRAASQMNNELYAQFPPFDDLEFLALANLPKENIEDGFDEDLEKHLYPEAKDAAVAGLKVLFAAIDPKFVAREIRQGHPFSQRAALASLELRQDRSSIENLFSLLSQLYDISDEETRRYVLLAIGQQSHPQAIPMLLKIATREKAADAEGAFIALVRSNQIEAISAVQNMLSTESVLLPKEKLIAHLSENFRREWNPFLLAALKERTPDVRAAALQGFVKIGHPQLADLLKKALHDSAPKVREAAFEALVERLDPPSEAVALEYALSLLAEGQINEQVVTMLNRTRDHRAAPLLVKQIEKNPAMRGQLLSVLAQVGNETSVRQLLKMLGELNTDERVQLFDLVTAFDLPEQFDVAKNAMLSESSDDRQAGIGMLIRLGTDDAVDTLAALISDEDELLVTQICYALGQIGTSRAEHFLKNFRFQSFKQDNLNGLRSATDGLRLWMSHSPGWNAIDSAYYHSRVDNHETALTYFHLATEIDPNLGIAYSGKGNTLLKLKKIDEAGVAFQKAYELDDFDGQAITGIGIVKAIQGEIEAAIQLTEESAKKFPMNNIFSYNTACVYGRAIEYLQQNSDPTTSKHAITNYQTKAIQSLKDSIEFGFDEFDLMRTDPDIDALRELPAFQQLLLEHAQDKIIP